MHLADSRYILRFILYRYRFEVRMILFNIVNDFMFNIIILNIYLYVWIGFLFLFFEILLPECFRCIKDLAEQTQSSSLKFAIGLCTLSRTVSLPSICWRVHVSKYFQVYYCLNNLIEYKHCYKANVRFTWTVLVPD